MHKIRLALLDPMIVVIVCQKTSPYKTSTTKPDKMFVSHTLINCWIFFWFTQRFRFLRI